MEGSGAGKSTLLNILTRELVETDGSTILLDGENFSDSAINDIEEYRK